MLTPPQETQPDETVDAPSPIRAEAVRSRWRKNLAIIVAAVIVVVAILGYVLIGFAYSANRIANTDRTLNAVISHQNSLNQRLDDVNSTFGVLSASSTYNPTEAKAAVDLFVANAASATATVGKDDASLTDASRRLNDQPWLSLLTRSNLDREASRIAHARKALADARIVAADYQEDGQFWEAFISTTQDLNAMTSAATSSQWDAARSAFGTMTTDAASALQLASAPGLPPELHSIMGDLQTFVSDYGKLIDASQAGDDAKVATASAAIQVDAGKLGAYDFDAITAKIAAFFKPLIDGFNSEMRQATS
ncbi:MAG TPA: hypothetical protein VGG31_02445 [Candidatus Dormibacteraeota bacterium]